MKIDIHSSPRLMVEHVDTIEKVFRKAVRKALLEHKRAGNAIAVWKDGRIQLIEPEDIVIEPDITTEQS